MKNKDLSSLINKWYGKNTTNPSKWSDNEVGQTIKRLVSYSGNWKNKARGKPNPENFNK